MSPSQDAYDHQEDDGRYLGVPQRALRGLWQVGDVGHTCSATVCKRRVQELQNEPRRLSGMGKECTMWHVWGASGTGREVCKGDLVRDPYISEGLG